MLNVTEFQYSSQLTVTVSQTAFDVSTHHIDVLALFPLNGRKLLPILTYLSGYPNNTNSFTGKIMSKL